MKLEERYIRTYDGFIRKIKVVSKENAPLVLCVINNKPYTINDIQKASFNVIDLMKEKDLVEIEYYSQRYNKRVIRLFEITYIDDEYINFDNSKCNFMLVNKQFTNSDKELKPIFKSIITCEQREQKSYKLGE